MGGPHKLPSYFYGTVGFRQVGRVGLRVRTKVIAGGGSDNYGVQCPSEYIFIGQL